MEGSLAGQRRPTDDGNDAVTLISATTPAGQPQIVKNMALKKVQNTSIHMFILSSLASEITLELSQCKLASILACQHPRVLNRSLKHFSLQGTQCTIRPGFSYTLSHACTAVQLSRPRWPRNAFLCDLQEVNLQNENAWADLGNEKGDEGDGEEDDEEDKDMLWDEFKSREQEEQQRVSNSVFTQ